MARKRRAFTPEFKAKVALEAIKGHRTIAELAAKHKIHGNQITTWKKQLLENAPDCFERAGGDKKAKTDEPDATELYEQIGRLNVQLEWLKKKVAEDD